MSGTDNRVPLTLERGGREKSGKTAASGDGLVIWLRNRGRNRRRGVEQLRARRFERGFGRLHGSNGARGRRLGSIECFGADLDSIDTDEAFEDLRVGRGNGSEQIVGSLLELPGGSG